ncbi:MAG: hypothetical protein ACJ796_05135 [Gemmatimonadaceae bacterium]
MPNTAALLVLAAAILAVVAPWDTGLTLAVVAVVIIVRGYVSVGAGATETLVTFSGVTIALDR